jgi:hypothetical protein
MTRRLALIALAAFLAVAPDAVAKSSGPPVRAGAAILDATYHIGPSAGQYSSDRLDGQYGDFDPHMETIKNKASYGVQSRNAAKAIVVKGPDGKLVALVRNDHYISQDALWRRTAQILDAETGGRINTRNLIMAVTHNHSSPFYSSLGAGVWTFQDVFDFRFFEYWARRQADAVEKAMADMHDVRVSATASYFDKTQRNSMGPSVADDGTPSGFPKSVTDHDMSVIRFDDIDNPKKPRPLATLVNLGQHGESLEGYDLISGEWTETVERIVDRTTGGITIFTQNATGTTEMERDSYHSIHERLLFDHAQYQQMEYAARLMADEAIGNWRDIGKQKPNPDDTPQEGQVSYHDRFVPWMTSFPVQMDDRWFAGPVSHPYPGVSSCRQDPTYAGDPRIPVAGLPDCESVDNGISDGLGLVGVDAPILPMRDVLTPLKQALPVQWPALSTDDLQALGIPVPENLSAPSYGALEDTTGVHLQAVRLGDILLTMCSCEQWSDQSINIKTRTDMQPGNEWLGYDWGKRCTDNGNGTWTCVDPRDPSKNLPPLSDALVQRMRAQVLNDATGWDDPACNRLGCGLQAESEPTDPVQIFGNYTHDDTTVRGGKAQSADYAKTYGYRMTVPIGFANDYNGYIATYREYQRGDHYRKALTGWGPHSSDYMATRLVRMGHALKGDAASKGALDAETDPAKGSLWAPLAAKELGDQAAAEARVRAVGEAASAGVKAYDATIPDDGGSETALKQPKDIERFDAATFSWDGGTNYVDNPQVVVQRREKDGWEPFADQTGEVPLTLKYPGSASLDEPWTLAAAQAEYRSGGQVWRYTASFEAFVSDFDLVDAQGREARATPVGTYRFVVKGRWRRNGATAPYTRVSDPFEVKAWDGITIEDAGQDADHHVTFAAGPSHAFDEPRVRNTETRSLGTLPVKIGPVDFPDTVRDPASTGARFLSAQRGYTANSPDDLEHYCLDCRFRPWSDATDELIAFVTIQRAAGGLDIETVRPRAGRFETKAKLGEGDRASIEIQDAWGDFSGQRVTVSRS